MPNSCLLLRVFGFWLCLLSATAAAQTERWVAVALEVNGKTPSLTALPSLQDTLAGHGKVKLLQPVEAATRYRAVVSALPKAVDRQTERALRRALSGALAHAAVHDWAGARRFEDRLRALEPSQQDDFFVGTGLAADAFALCTMNARPHMDAGDEAQAIDHLRDCVTDYPTVDLDKQSLAQDTLELMKKAQHQLAMAGQASLEIDLVGDESCDVYVNGMPWRTKPGADAGFPVVAVRVQLRCESFGRVHQVQLRPGVNKIRIDPRFERALVSQVYLGLRYATEAEVRRFRDLDARSIAQALEADAVLLLEATAGGDTVLRLVLPGPETPVVASVLILGPDPAQAEVAAAADQLLRRYQASKARVTSHALRPASDVERDTGLAVTPSATDSGFVADSSMGVDALDIAGISVGVLGLAGIVTSWSYYDLRRQYRNVVSAGDPFFQPRYVASGKNAMLLNVSGTVLLSASVPLWLPEYSDAPAVSWIAGGLGLTAVGVGAYLTASGEPCSRQRCPAGQPDSLLGPMVLVQSIPLLTVPVTYMQRSLLAEPGLQLSLAPGESGAEIRLVVPL